MQDMHDSGYHSWLWDYQSIIAKVESGLGSKSKNPYLTLNPKPSLYYYRLLIITNKLLLNIITYYP